MAIFTIPYGGSDIERAIDNALMPDDTLRKRWHPADARTVGNRITALEKSSAVYIANAGSTTAQQIADAIVEKKAIGALTPNNGILWMKEASVTSEGKLIFARFADGQGYLDLVPGAEWTEDGIKIVGNIFSLTTKETTMRDYTFRFKFRFTGTSGVDTEGNNRDEGIHINLLNDSTNPLIKYSESAKRHYKYKVRLSVTDGVQLTYDTNSVGDYWGVIAGKRKTACEGTLHHDTLPQELEVDTDYWIECQKDGNYIRIGVCKVEDGEPYIQCSYSDLSIGMNASGGVPTSSYKDAYVHGFEIIFQNKNNDNERAVIMSDAKFLKPVVSVNQMSEEFWQGVFTNEITAQEIFYIGGGSWGEYTAF